MERLHRCIDRYRSHTELDHILEMAEPCEAEIEGTILYSHIMRRVEDQELKQLNAARKKMTKKKMKVPFYALTLQDAELAGEGTKENSVFRNYLSERIRMEGGYGKQSGIFHLLSWSQDDLGIRDDYNDEELVGKRVRIVVERIPKDYFPGYILKNVIFLDEEEAQRKERVMKKVVENNKEISRLMEENMRLLMENGLRSREYDPIFDNEKDKIIFPRGYIKHKDEYEKLYQLDCLIHNDDVRSNVEYCLQMSDVYCFLDNYFSTYGSVNMAIKKAAFINLVAVMEALILLVVEDVRKQCGDCPTQKCDYRMSKRKNNLSERVQQLKNLNLFHWEEKDYDFMLKCIKLRNRIHLASLNEEEVKNDMKDYAKEFDKLHEELIDFLKKLSDALRKYMTPGTKECLMKYTKKGC